MTAFGVSDPNAEATPPRGFFGTIENGLGYLWTILLVNPLIVAATVVMGSISTGASFLDRSGRFQHGCARLWSRAILLVSGIRLQVEGLENVESTGKYVFCVNHQSYMDIPVLLVSLPFQFRFVAKKELFKVPFVGWHLRRAGHFSVDRNNPHAAMRALGRSVGRIREGTPVVIFPEGRTSRDGNIGPFKVGAFAIAAKSKANIVPVTIQGTRRTLLPGSFRVRGGAVKVTIWDAVPSNTMSHVEMATAVRDIVIARFEGDLS
jgi:1-acyl-sn-glycerol-3-phosphate acyltransferase